MEVCREQAYRGKEGRIIVQRCVLMSSAVVVFLRVFNASRRNSTHCRCRPSLYLFKDFISKFTVLWSCTEVFSAKRFPGLILCRPWLHEYLFITIHHNLWVTLPPCQGRNSYLYYQFSCSSLLLNLAFKTIIRPEHECIKRTTMVLFNTDSIFSSAQEAFSSLASFIREISVKCVSSKTLNYNKVKLHSILSANFNI